MTETKFKVGDKFRVVADTEKSWYNGKTGVVTEILTNDWDIFPVEGTLEDGSIDAWKDSEIEKIEEEPLHDFSVGDKVLWGPNNVKGEITEIDGERVCIRWSDTGGQVGYWYDPHVVAMHLRKEEIEPSPKFETGEIVKVVADDEEPENIGRLGQVLNPNDTQEWEEFPISVLLENGAVRWASEDELEKSDGWFIYHDAQDASVNAPLPDQDDENDPIVPNHYQHNGVNFIEFIEHMPGNRFNAMKYLFRAGVKNPETLLEDLKKAQWSLNREIERLEAL